MARTAGPDRIPDSPGATGVLLTPETCGWHYVPGLRLDDDPRLALFWDKIGLDHNGGRLNQDGHTVWFVGGQPKFIPETEWRTFMEEQRKLLSDRDNAIHRDATIHIDNREVKVQVRVAGDYIYGSTWGGPTGSQAVASIKRQESGIQGLPVMPQEELSSAKVVVETAGMRPVQQGPNLIVVRPDSPRVRFVLRDREIVYDRSGFHVEAASGQTMPK